MKKFATIFLIILPFSLVSVIALLATKFKPPPVIEVQEIYFLDDDGVKIDRNDFYFLMSTNSIKLINLQVMPINATNYDIVFLSTDDNVIALSSEIDQDNKVYTITVTTNSKFGQVQIIARTANNKKEISVKLFVQSIMPKTLKLD